MAAFDEDIRRYRTAPLRGRENQIARFHLERFERRVRLTPVAFKWLGYLGTAAGAAVAAITFIEKFGGH